MTTRHYVQSPAAEKDIHSVLSWTHEQFGEDARFRYEALLSQAIIDLAAEPERTGVIERDEICGGVFSYHL